MSTCKCAGQPLELPPTISTPLPFNSDNYSNYVTVLKDKGTFLKENNNTNIHYMIIGGLIVTILFLIKK